MNDGPSAVPDNFRLRLSYQPFYADAAEEELPLKVLVMGDFISRLDNRPLEYRKAININRRNFRRVMAERRLSLSLSVPNALDENGGELAVELDIVTLEDLEPKAVAAAVPQIREQLKRRQVLMDRAGAQAAAEAAIEGLDARVARQIDAILHHAEVQRLEGVWRGLAQLVDQLPDDRSIRVELLNVSKDDLLMDFEDSPTLEKSGLFRWVLTGHYGGSGGQPYGLILSTYAFGPGPQDMGLLRLCAEVAAVAHAPFATAAGPAFFDGRRVEDLGSAELEALFQQPKYRKWNELRDTEAARYLALTLPRLLMRSAHSGCVLPGGYRHDEAVVEDTDWLWGSAAWAWAVRVMASHERHRWCASIVGDHGPGVVRHWPRRATGQALAPSSEQIIDEASAKDLANHGFLAMVSGSASRAPCFVTAPSVAAKAPAMLKGKAPVSREDWFASRLDYLFIACPFARYFKVMHRERIRAWKEREDLQAGLWEWLGRYVAPSDGDPSAPDGDHPLADARVTVRDAVEGRRGHRRFDLRIRPNIRCGGQVPEVALHGRLELE